MWHFIYCYAECCCAVSWHFIYCYAECRYAVSWQFIHCNAECRYAVSWRHSEGKMIVVSFENNIRRQFVTQPEEKLCQPNMLQNFWGNKLEGFIPATISTLV